MSTLPLLTGVSTSQQDLELKPKRPFVKGVSVYKEDTQYTTPVLNSISFLEDIPEFYPRLMSISFIEEDSKAVDVGSKPLFRFAGF